MSSDLTERLAAKLGTWMAGDSEVYLDDYGENTLNAKDVAHHAATILPLLLSEPELVASLPDEVRLSVLTPRERAVMKLGEADVKRQSSLEAFADPEVLGDDPKGDVWLADNEVYLAALAEARALTPEGKDGD